MRPLYEERVKPYLTDITDMIKRGLTEREVAKSLGIAYSSFNKYKTQHSELVDAIKNADMRPLIKNLENALVKKALGYDVEEEKKVGKKDQHGEQVILFQKTKRHIPPDTTAIFGALNRFDPNYVKDKAYYNLKKEELELKKAVAEANNFDLEL